MVEADGGRERRGTRSDKGTLVASFIGPREDLGQGLFAEMCAEGGLTERVRCSSQPMTSALLIVAE